MPYREDHGGRGRSWAAFVKGRRSEQEPNETPRCRGGFGRRPPDRHWPGLAATVACIAAGAVHLTANGSAARAAAPATPPAHIESCAACHGPQGRSSVADIPHLAGQQLSYLVKQLQAFQSGDRKNDLMQAIAGQLTREDIQAVARYWSSLPPDGGRGSGEPSTAPVASSMAYPTGFPADYSEYDRENDEKSRVITVRYANRVALEAARKGQPLPSGSVLVSANYAAVLSADGRPELDAKGQWKLGTVRSLAGMESQTGWGEPVPKLLRNGDWNYGLWTPDGQSRLRGMHPQCLACHQPKAAQSYVFTWDALRKPLSDPH